MSKEIKYVVVSPVRNEEKYLEKTIQSMLAQTVKPAEWLIVDDGSSDNTGAIIDAFAAQHPWLRAIYRNDRGYRKSGGGVIEAFYAGYEALKTDDWDFVVKLDGDLSFADDFFEKCFERFRQNPQLGIAGGTICSNHKGILTVERKQDPAFHVRGATKIYSRRCWEAIGGLLKATGWDTLDEVKANMLGWDTLTLPNINVIHHRHTGKADGFWRDMTKNGVANFISGYHPLFMAFKCLKRTVEKPYLLGSIALLHGFISGYLKKIPQINDKALIRYLRKQQINRILFKKTIWK